MRSQPQLLHLPIPHYPHSAPSTLQKPLFQTRLHSLSSLQSNRWRIPINMYLLPACGLDADGRAGAGCEPESSTKAAPHLPVFATLNPPPHHYACSCVVPALALPPLLLNLTASARVICMRAAASGSGGCCRWRTLL